MSSCGGMIPRGGMNPSYAGLISPSGPNEPNRSNESVGSITDSHDRTGSLVYNELQGKSSNSQERQKILGNHMFVELLNRLTAPFGISMLAEMTHLEI